VRQELRPSCLRRTIPIEGGPEDSPAKSPAGAFLRR